MGESNPVGTWNLLVHYLCILNMVPRMIGMATKVVSDYGKVLSTVEPGVYGLPESLLPHPRESIRFAILTLLRQLGSDHPEVKEGLRHGYVYLSQFVGDDEAELAKSGQASVTDVNVSDASAEPAMRIINQIKLDMERAVEEMRDFP